MLKEARINRSEFIRGIAFICLFFMLLARLNVLLLPKTYPHSLSLNQMQSIYYEPVRITGFYNLPKNSCDVVFLGASQLHCGVDPNTIFESYGITGYNFTADGQPFTWSSYYLEEALRYQSPGVVVLDVGFLFLDEGLSTIQWQHWSNDFLKNSWNKYRFIMENFKQSDAMEMAFPFYRYHDRWKELDAREWNYFSWDGKDRFHGFYAYMSFNPQIGQKPETDPQGDTEGEVKLNDKYLQELSGMKQLCDERGIELLFIKTPIIKSGKEEQMIRLFGNHCEYNGWKFMDFSTREAMDQMLKLDYNVDFEDPYHLSYTGAQKLSLLIGKIIQRDYHFEPHTAAEIQLWKENAEYVRTLYGQWKK